MKFSNLLLLILFMHTSIVTLCAHESRRKLPKVSGALVSLQKELSELKLQMPQTPLLSDIEKELIEMKDTLREMKKMSEEAKTNRENYEQKASEIFPELQKNDPCPYRRDLYKSALTNIEKCRRIEGHWIQQTEELEKKITKKEEQITQKPL